LNDQDDVVGVSGDHAFLYHRGRLSDLGTLPGDLSSSANAINDNGEIVGVSQDVDGNSRAFVYVNCQMYDLNSLVDTGSVTLQEAVGINSQAHVIIVRQFTSASAESVLPPSTRPARRCQSKSDPPIRALPEHETPHYCTGAVAAAASGLPFSTM
jgi:probable HAF family extracellular repeat protein